MSSVRLFTASAALLLLFVFAAQAGAERLPANASAEEIYELPTTYNPFYRAFDGWTGGPRLERRKVGCHDVYSAPDQCAFIKEHCDEEQVGMLDYFDLYYCKLGNARPLAFTIMSGWLVVLFSTIGIAASDFFCVNLSTIASVLGMSESLAGVTFLALGNGSPDVFSTFAAMKVGSGSLAVGELIGAASFITAVVAGSMAIVNPFKVSRRSFLRDVLFFMVSVVFGLFFLADGRIHQWECIVMILYYILYVVFVITWHWISTKKRRQRKAEKRARSHHIQDEEENLLGEDDEDDEDAGVGGADEAPGTPDIRILEAGGVDEEDEEMLESGWAEISNEMRLNRPRLDRRTTLSGAPHMIRPSLIGALEFRAVSSSLATLGTKGHYHLRRVSDDGTGFTAEPHAPEPAWRPGRLTADGPVPSTPSSLLKPGRRTHQRAVSVDDVRHGAQDSYFFPPRARTPDLLVSDADAGEVAGLQTSARTSPEEQTPGSKADGPPSAAGSLNGRPPKPHPRLEIPDQQSTTEHLTPLSQLLTPSLLVSDADAPLDFDRSRVTTPLSPRSPRSPRSVGRRSPRHSRPPSLILPRPSLDSSLYAQELGLDDLKRVKYWPYSWLPPPQHLCDVLFPTLRNFTEKTVLQKLLATASVPPVFLLTITLPVVEDTKKSSSSKDVSGTASTVNLPPESPASFSSIPSTPYTYPESPGHPPPPPPTWNRWLVAVQCITAPLCLVILLFPPSLLTCLYALIIGLLFLLLLLTTTHPTLAPRHHASLTFFGFIVSITWISTIATEVVGVLKALGTIFAISDAILGLTVFAVGNSLGDLVADITVARLGYPVMALSACFGGPMLNILLGIGGSGLYMTTREKKHGKPYHIQISSTLAISAATLLCTLGVLAVWVPLNGWRMSRPVGWTLVGIWGVGTVVNLGVEMAGVGKQW